MNYLVQHGKVRGQVINVPDGLPELLSDVTREVLRCQPTTECLCQFIIDYLHSIIKARDKTRVAKMVIDQALRKVDEIIGDLCICNIGAEKCGDMMIMMENCFKRFLEKYRCEKHHGKEVVKFQDFDMLNELINKCHFTQEELKISGPLIEDAYNRFVDTYMKAQEASDSTEALYLYFKERERKRLELEMQNEAAIAIQANFRGYMVRREIYISKKEAECKAEKAEEEHDEEEDINLKDQAARTIQRFFRSIQSTSVAPEEHGDEDVESKVSVTPKVLAMKDGDAPADDAAEPVEAIEADDLPISDEAPEEVAAEAEPEPAPEAPPSEPAEAPKVEEPPPAPAPPEAEAPPPAPAAPEPEAAEAPPADAPPAEAEPAAE